MLICCIFPTASPILDVVKPDVSFYVPTNHSKKRKKTHTHTLIIKKKRQIECRMSMSAEFGNAKSVSLMLVPKQDAAVHV